MRNRHRIANMLNTYDTHIDHVYCHCNVFHGHVTLCSISVDELNHVLSYGMSCAYQRDNLVIPHRLIEISL